MRDAGYRTPEKAKIIYPPPGGGHNYHNEGNNIIRVLYCESS